MEKTTKTMLRTGRPLDAGESLQREDCHHRCCHPAMTFETRRRSGQPDAIKNGTNATVNDNNVEKQC